MHRLVRKTFSLKELRRDFLSNETSFRSIIFEKRLSINLSRMRRSNIVSLISSFEAAKISRSTQSLTRPLITKVREIRTFLKNSGQT